MIISQLQNMVGHCLPSNNCIILYSRSRFYVNTEAKPPLTTWIHPLGPVPTPSPERRYSPPTMAPPGDASSTYADGRGYNPTGYNSGGYPGGNSGGNSYPYQQQEPYGGGRSDPRSEYGGTYEQHYPQHSAGGRGVGTFILRSSVISLMLSD